MHRIGVGPETQRHWLLRDWHYIYNLIDIIRIWIYIYIYSNYRTVYIHVYPVYPLKFAGTCLHGSFWIYWIQNLCVCTSMILLDICIILSYNIIQSHDPPCPQPGSFELTAQGFGPQTLRLERAAQCLYFQCQPDAKGRGFRGFRGFRMKIWCPWPWGYPHSWMAFGKTPSINGWWLGVPPF